MLVYLASVTAVVGLFAWSFYALMQPTVLPNAGLTHYKEPGPATIFLYRIDTSAERMENAAIAAAEQANREQGIEALRAYASATPSLAASSRVATKAPAPAAKPPKQAKPRPVMRREPAPDRWGWNLAFGSNNWFGSSGGRPLWSGGRAHY